MHFTRGVHNRPRSRNQKGLRERGRLWTPRVKCMFGQHLHSVEYLMLPHRKSEQRGFAQHTTIAPRSAWAHRVLCRLPRNSGRANRCGHTSLYSSPLPRSVFPTAPTCTTMGMSSIALDTTHTTNVYDTDSWQ